ncbi:MAG: hypothetical protein ABH804_00235 [archaeon]
MKTKKAAMEMSVGTIVTIVLLMTVLVLGLVLVREIFFGAIDNIKGIDQAVKNEINKLFAEDSSRKVVVYPSTRKIIIKKGEDDLGFGFSIRNVENAAEKFSYEISVVEISCSDSMRNSDAIDLITLGKERTGIEIPAGSIMTDPIFIRFGIPENAPPCEVRYQIQIYKSSRAVYTPPVDVDLQIKSK